MMLSLRPAEPAAEQGTQAMLDCEAHINELWFTFGVIATLLAVGAFALGYGLRANMSLRRRLRAGKST